MNEMVFNSMSILIIAYLIGYANFLIFTFIFAVI